ncbi:hypothetical protein GGI22_000795 [Coemansia erecta]|nr:hypothetical protein GGI22_000795 [Coemansia erecta]
MDLFTDKHGPLFTGTPLFATSICFHAARTITITCMQGDDIPNANSEASQAASLLSAKRIRELAPNAHTVVFDVNFSNDTGRYGPDLWDIVNRFIAHLCMGKQTVELLVRSTYRLPPEPTCTPSNITDLTIYWNEGSAQDATALMHMNAKQLLRLTLTKVKTNDFHRLLITSEGQNVTYTSLVSLRIMLQQQSYETAENRPTFGPTAVPFPKLAWLYIESLYPFGDDVVFRGNMGTLRSMCIRTNEATLAMLNTAKTFARGRFTALQTVKLHSYMDAIESTHTSWLREYIQFFECIHQCVENLQVVFGAASRRLLARIHRELEFAMLRQLDVCEAHLSLRDILRTLKAVPALQRLRSRLAAVPMFLSTAQNASRVAGFCQKHRNASARFQQWDIYYGEARPDTSYSSVYAAFLAVVCPHFVCLRVQQKSHDKHCAGIAALQRTTFGAYAARLQRLLVSV